MGCVQASGQGASKQDDITRRPEEAKVNLSVKKWGHHEAGAPTWLLKDGAGVVHDLGQTKGKEQDGC